MKKIAAIILMGFLIACSEGHTLSFVTQKNGQFEQGLNSVFDTDSTIRLIKEYTNKLF
jgi:hypothetical protein